MKAVIIEAYGGAEQLKLADVPAPRPEDHEVLIQLAYTSVNPVDWKIREGLLQNAFPYQFPIILGWDAAGTVAAVGKSAGPFQAGERVYAYCRKPKIQHGTYAEYVTMDASAVAPMPANVGFREAAVMPLVGLTAWQALFDFARVQAGHRVLIHAGAGGVGGMAIQLARHAGAKVYTTAGRKNQDYVKALGADVAINYARQDFVEAIRAAEPEGIDVVLDTLGGEVQLRSYEALRRGGTLVSIVDTPDPKTASRYGVNAGFVFVSPNGRQLREIAALIESGSVKTHFIEEMRLEDAAAAQEKSRAHHVQGKIALRIK